MENMETEKSENTESTKPDEHGPGPPLTVTTGSITDDDLGKELHRKEGELQHLKSELQSCVGKLKGYQVLGQLYEDTKKQCDIYQQENVKMSKQLDSLTKRLLPPNVDDSDAVLSDSQRNADSGTTNTEGQLVSLRAELKDESGRQRSTASSPSFVQIISSTSDSSPSSLIAMCKSPPGVQEDERLDSMTEFGSASMEVQQLTEHLKNLEQSGGSASVQNLSSNLIRTSLSVLKLEKKTRVQKAMLEQMSSKISEMQTSLDVKDETLKLLQEDRERLAAELQQLQTARDDAMREAKSKLSEIGTDPDDARLSGDWLTVDRHVSSGQATENAVTAVSTNEVELRRRVDKLSSMISELVSVNRTWDDHCKQLEATHSRQMAAVESELSEVHRRLNEQETSDDRRQQEFDELLLNAKKQRESEEMAKEDALSQLHIEKRLRVEAEERCSEFSRKMAELEDRMYTLQTTRHTDLVEISIPTQNTSQPASNEMMTELQVLREQVTVFKEDFDQERRDREASQTAMERMKQKLSEANIELGLSKQKLDDSLINLRSTKVENHSLKDRLHKVGEELKSLQRQVQRPVTHQMFTAAPTTAATALRYRHQAYPYSTTIQQTPSAVVAAVAEQKWQCATCTYENLPQRQSCEMCGRFNEASPSRIYYPTRYEDEVHNGGGRPVAGLQLYQPTLPNRSLWRPLANSNLEIDQ